MLDDELLYLTGFLFILIFKLRLASLYLLREKTTVISILIKLNSAFNNNKYPKIKSLIEIMRLPFDFFESESEIMGWGSEKVIFRLTSI